MPKGHIRKILNEKNNQFWLRLLRTYERAYDAVFYPKGGK
jgi:hypothetical protein